MSHAWGPETTSKPLLFWRTSIFETRIMLLTHHMGPSKSRKQIWVDIFGIMKQMLRSVWKKGWKAHHETVVMEKAGKWCLSHEISVIIWNCPYFRSFEQIHD